MVRSKLPHVPHLISLGHIKIEPADVFRVISG